MKKNNNRRKKRDWTGLGFVLPGFLGVMIFSWIPYLDVICRSFTTAISGEWRGIANYKIIFENRAFLLAVINTLRFELVCIPLLLGSSLGVALLLWRRGLGRNLLKSCYLMPMAIPVASVVLLWQILFDERGLLSGLLHLLGLQGQDWMNTGWAFWILVVSYLWKNLGYTVILWMAGLSAIPTGCYEAARVDGAGDGQCFLYITLPNLLPVFFTITVLSILNSFKMFREVYLVAGDYPHESIYMLSHLFNNWYRELAMDKMAAAAVVNGTVIFLFVLLLRKAWNKEER